MIDAVKHYFRLPEDGVALANYNPWHIGQLVIMAAGILLLIIYGKKLGSWKGRDIVRVALACLLLAEDLTRNIFNLFQPEYVKVYLPLYICHCTSLATMLALFTRNRTVFTFGCIYGLFGGIVAMLTPDYALYLPPHLYYETFFIHHVAMVWGILYLLIAEGMRPTGKGWFAAQGFFLVIAAVSLYVNARTGANYNFLTTLPVRGSLFDWIPAGFNAVIGIPGYILISSMFYLLFSGRNTLHLQRRAG